MTTPFGPVWNHKEEICLLYERSNLTANQIAPRFGVSVSTIYVILRACGAKLKPSARYPEAPEERFWKLVDKSDGCWEWRGTFRGEYGIFSEVWNTTVGAHRFSWELHFGKIQDGLWVLHKCDNPKCVRPDHLFLGTPKDNVDDKVIKGRQAKGESCAKAKLTETQVLEVLRMRKTGLSLNKLSSQMGIPKTTVYHIIHGDTWKYIPR